MLGQLKTSDQRQNWDEPFSFNLHGALPLWEDHRGPLGAISAVFGKEEQHLLLIAESERERERKSRLRCSSSTSQDPAGMQIVSTSMSDNININQR